MPPPTPAVGLNATLEIVKANGDSRTIGAGEPAVTSVDFGLWDNAYDPVGNVVTSADVAQDFISGDSRRFYFRVRHEEAAGNKFVTMEWWTLYKNGKRLDSPSVPTLTLTEVEPGVFVSSAVMLASERVDLDQGTHSQLTDAQVKPQFEPRYHEASDHRLRLGSMFGKVEARYPSGGDVKVRATAGIFTGRRRVFSVQVFVIRNAFADDAEYNTTVRNITTNFLRKVTGVYERLGIWFYAAPAPGSTPIHMGADIEYDVVPIEAPTTGPGAVANPALLTVEETTRIANAHPAIGLQARLFFCKALASGHGGDTAAPNNQPATGLNYASFVAVNGTVAPYAAAHELGHSLTQTAGPGQAHYDQPTMPVGNRLLLGRNLMGASHPSLLSPPMAGENTRLWDVADLHGYNQYNAMRTCRLTGPMQ